MRIILITLLVAVLNASAALAQEVPWLQVTVTSASGRSVFLDRGRGAGIVPGMTVRLFPPDGGPVEGIVRDVSSNNARVELPPGVPLPPVGTRGEVEPTGAPIPDQEPPTSGEGLRDRLVPDHPPWTLREDERSADMPLLSPAFGQRPEERAIRFDGRVFSQLLYTTDQGRGRNSDYALGRLGTWVEATNLFGQGGRTLFAGEFVHRVADLRDDSEDSTRIRVDRLSYAIGGQDYAPYRVEMGRFYSLHVPELGVLDGMEAAVQLENGMRAGAGVGVYPRPFPNEGWGEDTGLHAFVDYRSEASHHLSTTLAVQKTWHEGEPDRDMLFGRISANPTDSLWLFSSWRFDLYTSSDTIKGNGVELTEFWAQARYTIAKNKGVALSVSHYSWPELKRREFVLLPPDLVRDGHVERVDLSGWYRPRKNFRLSARINSWFDHRDEGFGGEFGANWIDPKASRPDVHAAIYFTDGTFSDGVGFRVEGRQRIRSIQAFLGYNVFDFSSSGGVAASGDATRHTFRGGVDWNVGKWYYSLTGDYYVSTAENAFTLGLFAQYRF